MALPALAPPVLLQASPLADPLVVVLLVLVASVLPPVLFAVYLRNAERHRPEPWRSVLRAFLWGGSVAVVLAVVAQLLFAPYVDDVSPFGLAAATVATVLVAPVTEELAKGFGLAFVRDRDPEPEDGYVYGGALGFGFAATENVLYVAAALLLQGQEVAVVTAAYRGLVTVALHGAASAIAGAGLWHGRHRGMWGLAVGAVLLAVLLHAAYNFAVSEAPAIAALLAGAGALYAFWRVRKRVRLLDREGAMLLP